MQQKCQQRSQKRARTAEEGQDEKQPPALAQAPSDWLADVAQQLLADAKAQHLEVKQIFREWKPLGASVVASWRITAAPLLRLRKVPLRAYADVERIFAFERKIKPMLKTLKTEVRAAKAAKDAAAREMDDFDRSVRRRVARDVLGIPMSRIIVLIEIGKCTCAEGVSSLLLLYGIVCEREKNGPQPRPWPLNTHPTQAKTFP